MSRTGWGPSSISSTVEEKCYIKGHYLLKNSCVVMEYLGKMQNCELNIGSFIHPEKSWSLLFMDTLCELKSAPHHLPVLHFKMQDSVRVLPDMKSSDTFPWLGNLHASTLICSSPTLHRCNCIHWCSRWFYTETSWQASCADAVEFYSMQAMNPSKPRCYQEAASTALWPWLMKA